ncbi:hypothetical protein MG293_009920 [Ovis ammon polii]|uniref:Uncharacterized protein n=1 Tax=Ovis ammon polii TaxID=230172 RepID=A0AAD4U9G2_OVIAM|nr:hypothetical protein MG293_009920 [Ovis ammon polii]KAI4566009.1 hypothetical protein MJT46_009384 [Ovis ammon polii x Ovis aries]
MRGSAPSPRPLALAPVLRCDSWDHFRPRARGPEALLEAPGVSVRSAHAGSTRQTAFPPRHGCGHRVGRVGREETRLQVLGASGLLAASERAPRLPRAQRGQCGREWTGAVSSTYRTVYGDTVSERTAAADIVPSDKYSTDTLSRVYSFHHCQHFLSAV